MLTGATDLRIHQPETLEEALEVLSDFGDEAAVISGGTAIVLMLKAGLIAPEALVSLRKLDGLSYIERDEGELRFGALTPIRSGETSLVVRDALPVLAKTFGDVGNVRVRNAATIGGNLAEADYASDPPTVLMALRASIIARSVRGERVIPITELFTDFYETSLEPDEVITEVRVPHLADSAKASYLKFVTRSSEDRPCVGTAAVVDLDAEGVCRSLRVVVGAVAATPQEFPEAEQLATGRALDPGLIAEIGEAYAELVDPIDDLRGSKWYRRRITGVFVCRAIESALAR